MARTIIVDNIKFTIIEELDGHIDTQDGDESFHKAFIGEAQCWPKQDDVESLSVFCGQFRPKAKIEAEYVGGGDFRSELKRWRAGYTQNVNSFTRHGDYIDPTGRTKSGNPFTPNATVVVDGGTDAPHLVLPTTLASNNAQPHPATLHSATGGDTFDLWLAPAREPVEGATGDVDRACIVLISRVAWQSHYDSQPTPDAPLTFRLPPLLTIEPPVLCEPLIALYYREDLVRLTKYPDLRANACANDFNYGEENSFGDVLRWVCNDDDEARPYKLRPAPTDASNFLRARHA